jgi:hypothetical protein
MPTFAELRAALPPEVKRFLDFVWDHYLTAGAWPTSRIVYAKFLKEQVIKLLTPLDGALVMEV